MSSLLYFLGIIWLLRLWCFQCLENKELQEKICRVEQQLAAFKAEQANPSSERCVSDEYIDELRRKIQSQVILRAFYPLLIGLHLEFLRWVVTFDSSY